MLRRMAQVRTDVSEELSAPFISVTRIGELGTTLAVTGNRRTLRRNTIDNIKMDLKAVGWVMWTVLRWLRVETGRRLLWTRWLHFGLHNLLGRP
jgi:hypothetical protein